MIRELMPWAQLAEAVFQREFGDRGCTCFLSPPCSYCTHEGNPLNLENTPEAWGAARSHGA